jgi:hypothetical protein
VLVGWPCAVSVFVIRSAASAEAAKAFRGQARGIYGLLDYGTKLRLGAVTSSRGVAGRAGWLLRDPWRQWPNHSASVARGV